MIELISQQELKFIDLYRKKYTGHIRSQYYQPTEIILSDWERAKSKFLKKVFQNKLILEKTINIDTPKEELMRKFDEQIKFASSGSTVEKAGQFIDIYRHTISKYFAEQECFFIKYNLLDIINTYELIKNHLDVRIIIPAGTYTNDKTLEQVKIEKPITFLKGTKNTKILNKLSQIFRIPYFEEFRLLHSQILNKKKATGQLCLSIHPLDYMTMSDNANDWSSCMSWRDSGCYRLGTVEMMNSDCVVVAYLKDKNPMYIEGNANSPGFEWNSKKWRCLYIVSADFISSIKHYPMHLPKIGGIAAQWLRDLVQQAYPDSSFDNDFSFYEQEAEYERDYDDDDDDDDYSEDYDAYKNHYFISTPLGKYLPITEHMYNDFGTTVHTGFMSNNSVDMWCNNIYYSGNPQCMCCGKDFEAFGAEGTLICDDCDNTFYCEYCSSIMNKDDAIAIDNFLVCPHCASSKTLLDSFTKERHININCHSVFIIDDDKDIEHDFHVLTKLYIFDFDKIKHDFPIYKQYDIRNFQIEKMPLTIQTLVKAKDITQRGWQLLYSLDELSRFNTPQEWIKYHSDDDIRFLYKTGKSWLFEDQEYISIVPSEIYLEKQKSVA